MLETMYAVAERYSTDAEAVTAFAEKFIQSDEMEDAFYQVVRDSRLSGFREGMKAALMLFAEVR